MEPEPPEPDQIGLALSLAPALLAAAFSLASAVMSQLSPARRVALRDNLPPARRHALDRYLKSPSRVEARWLLLRVSGVATTAALWAVEFSRTAVSPSWALAAIAASCAYAIPSEAARQLSQNRAEHLAPLLLYVLRPAEWLIAPLSDPLNALASRFLADQRSRPPSAAETGSELELIVSEGELSGSLDHEQSEMIRNVLDFGEVTAEEVMVPRIHVDALDVDLSMEQVMTEIQLTRHSRYPVFAESVDNIIGIVHVKDLFPSAVGPGQRRPGLRDLMRKPVAFVPEAQLASTVLKDMRAGRHHMAVIIDEFGGFSGIVTLEDLLEEIVGDIQDEHDGDDQDRIHLLSDGHVLVDASLPVADVNRQLGTTLPEGDDYVSLGGLLLQEIGRVPPPGSRHELLGLSVLIREADARRVALVELSGLPGPTGDRTKPGDDANAA